MIHEAEDKIQLRDSHRRPAAAIAALDAADLAPC